MKNIRNSYYQAVEDKYVKYNNQIFIVVDLAERHRLLNIVDYPRDLCCGWHEGHTTHMVYETYQYGTTQEHYEKNGYKVEVVSDELLYHLRTIVTGKFIDVKKPLNFEFCTEFTIQEQALILAYEKIQVEKKKLNELQEQRRVLGDIAVSEHWISGRPMDI